VQADLAEILKVVGGEKVNMMRDKGDPYAGIISLRQGLGMIHNMPLVKKRFEGIIAQAAGMVKKPSAN